MQFKSKNELSLISIKQNINSPQFSIIYN